MKDSLYSDGRDRLPLQERKSASLLMKEQDPDHWRSSLQTYLIQVASRVAANGATYLASEVTQGKLIVG